MLCCWVSRANCSLAASRQGWYLLSLLCSSRYLCLMVCSVAGFEDCMMWDSVFARQAHSSCPCCCYIYLHVSCTIPWSTFLFYRQPCPRVWNDNDAQTYQMFWGLSGLMASLAFVVQERLLNHGKCQIKLQDFRSVVTVNLQSKNVPTDRFPCFFYPFALASLGDWYLLARGFGCNGTLFRL